MAYLPAYYGWLLLWPAELCCEYSYNCIPAVEWDLPWNEPRLVTMVIFWGALLYAIWFGLGKHREDWALGARQTTQQQHGALILCGSMMMCRLTYVVSSSVCSRERWTCAAQVVPQLAGAAHAAGLESFLRGRHHDRGTLTLHAINRLFESFGPRLCAHREFQ